MREILFRGKRADNGDWVYGDLCHGEYGKVFILYDNDAVITSKKNELTSWGFIEVDPETIGQYAGLKGRNGNKIFEGDILKLAGSYEETDGSMQPYEEIHKIVYMGGCFYSHNIYWRLLCELVDGLHEGETYEIIGNIHDGV